MGHYREAMGVHENVLRLVVEGDDGDDRTLDAMDAGTARQHLELLKQSFLRLKGWDKSAGSYVELVNALVKMYKGSKEWKDVKGVETWSFHKEQPSETLGKFAAPKEWEFARRGEIVDDGDGGEGNPKGEMKGLRREGMGVKRATSNWGMGEVHRMLGGLGEERKMASEGLGMSKKPEVATKALVLDGDDDGFESAEEEVGKNVNGNDVKV